MTAEDYREGLRRNREGFVDALVSDESPDTRAALLRRVAAIQSETRGKLGELFGEVALTALEHAVESMITRDRQVFDTPFGKRRIDVWDVATRHAVEVKSGHVTYRRFVRRQVAKDAWLLQAGQVERVTWRLLNGGSAPLLRALAAHGIGVEIGWPDLR